MARIVIIQKGYIVTFIISLLGNDHLCCPSPKGWLQNAQVLDSYGQLGMHISDLILLRNIGSIVLWVESEI